MKKLSYIIITMLLLSTISITSQNIVDSNTEIIENYFIQQDNNIPKIAAEKITINFESDVIIIQNGNKNNIEIDTSGENNQKLIQNGNDNNYEYYTYYNNIDTDLKIDQNGNNNEIQIYGQNSLTKDMQIKQNTNNQTIIIRNYN